MHQHKHKFETLRWERNTGHRLVRKCKSCGEVQRKVRGRWVGKVEGKRKG